MFGARDAGRCGEDLELWGVGGETEAAEKQSEDVRDFGPWCASVGVQLIDDEAKLACGFLRRPRAERVVCQPAPRLREDVGLDRSHQHNVEHRVISNEDI